MIKFRISLFLFNLSIAAVTIFEASTLSKPALSKDCPAYNSSVVQAYRRENIRLGKILVQTPRTNVTIKITLYSPLFPNSIYATWSLSEKISFLSHDGKPLIVGDDWGIQITEYNSQGRGYSSCIYPLAQVGIAPGEVTFRGGSSTFSNSVTPSSYNGPNWVVNVDNIWQGKKPRPQSAPE